ncbi:Embryogenesis-associated protein EMB8 [Acorus gramineus]|uniref:Embryogenesis-associated protein EMB8 n=1 Tax=Acorus gramineus TaxID=55184 RepID=A0AAV9A2L0_ACOGR|nr:Embryogenesis-associated protein EMB8 [Acorus gramineus]
MVPANATSSPSDSLRLEIVGAGRSLVHRLPSLNRPYKPFPVIGWNCHTETIFAAFFRALPDVRYRRECLRTRDDGAVALDWVCGDDREIPAASPVLILLPGLTGGSGDTYVRHMLVKARSKRWRVVVFNSRGCADSPVTTPRVLVDRWFSLFLSCGLHELLFDMQFYSASFTEDLRHVVKHVGTRYPGSRLYTVGWSLGANILVRYLAEESHNCALSGAVSLCNPFDLVLADENFHKGFNVVYNRSLARALQKIFKKHALLFVDMGGEYNIQAAANPRSIREFDEGLTRVSFGFKSVDEYYINASSSRSIAHVHTPLLCIQAANDPFAPGRGIPRKDIEENPYCLLIVTPEGGHLGWVAGDEAPFGAPWTDPVVMEFLEHLESGSIENPSPFQANSAGQSPDILHQFESIMS